MQLQTSIRSCEGNHYVVTVINDAAENSGLLSNNPCAQGAFEGRGPVAKETDDIQNGPRSTVLLSSLSLSFSPPTDFFFFFLPQFFFFSFCLETSCRATFEDLRDFEKFVLWGVWELLFNLYLCLYWFHKGTPAFSALFVSWVLFSCARVHYLLLLIYSPLKLNLVVIKSEANWG